MDNSYTITRKPINITKTSDNLFAVKYDVLLALLWNSNTNTDSFHNYTASL